MYFFELVTLEPICGYSCYYYFATGKHNAPRSLEMTNKYSDKLRLLIEDREETPIILECIDALRLFLCLFLLLLRLC